MSFSAKTYLCLGILCLVWLMPGTAAAYDWRDCAASFGWANVEKIHKISIDGGEADFGDHLHVLGKPQGHAVICWEKRNKGGRVAIYGRLFGDCLPFICGWSRVRIKLTGPGGASNDFEEKTFSHNNDAVAFHSSNEFFNRVRIRLYKGKIDDFKRTKSVTVKRSDKGEPGG